MEEIKVNKIKHIKKIFVLFGIIILIVACFFAITQFEKFKTRESGEGPGTEGSVGGQVQVNNTPAPTCSDRIKNQGEIRIDCGGPCNACPPICSDGILNQDETGVDCGGIICSACPTCFDNIQNQGERHIDCGGPCIACPPDCSDGIKNQNETDIDCGGQCNACPTCSDGIKNQEEIRIDCGGPCNACPPICSDGILNQDETGVDCGGPCNACAQRPTITTEQRNLIGQTLSSSAFVKDMPEKGIIALRFYDFFIGERIWHDDILIGKGGILSGGTPDITLMMHAKYISQLNGENLCDVISSAKTNGEMWVESDQSDAKLLLKYSGMIKYRDCLGF